MLDAPLSAPPRKSLIVYGHRGASLELPENTVESFERALSVGASAIETDCHLTRDGVVVLAHDPDGLRTAGDPRRIRDLTLDEVRAWDVSKGFREEHPGLLADGVAYRVPTLEGALRALPDAFFMVDIKPTEGHAATAVVEVVRKASAQQRVRLVSFSPRNLKRVRGCGYEGETGMSSLEVLRAVLLPRFLARTPARAAQLPRKGYGVTLDNTRVLERLHALGARVDYWVINDPDEARRLLAMGADGVVTDDPRTVAAAVATSPR